MCVPVHAALSAFGTIRSPGKLVPDEALELKGNARDLRIWLSLLDPFQNPGKPHFKLNSVGNRLMFQAA